MSKTLLFHDTFLMRGWAERMNIEIAKSLDTDIATAIWSRDCYDARAMWYHWSIIEIDPGFKKGMLWFLKMKWKFFKSRKLLSKYDTVLFSNEAISGIWAIQPGTKTLYYAHSISRHLFDQRSEYLAKVSFFIKPIYLISSIFLKWIYIQEINKIDTIFVNSQSNKKRISEYFWRDDSIVIYPSVDTQKFNISDKNTVSQILAIEWISLLYKDYYVSFSRLTHAKRIDTIIRAFQKIPEKNIVILYGENDSQKDEFIKLWAGYPNIIFHALSDNNNLPYILNWSIASICISENEDFGMVSIESMACWVPVIAVDEWWYRESIIVGKTWYMINPKQLENDLISTIKNTTKESFSNMQNDCRIQSEKFSLENMNIQIKKYI